MKKKIICAVLIAAVILLSCCAILIQYFVGGKERIAYIYSDDKLVKTIDLNSVEQSYSLVITNSSGGSNTVEVRRGKIGVTQATCPDEICEKTGFIDSPLVPIVCLPNNLVIKISSSENENIIPDTVTR